MERRLRKLGGGAAAALALIAAGNGEDMRPSARTVLPAAAQSARPNVLFIMIDDLRPDLGVYGNRAAHTPHMDALARSGLVFDRAYTQQAVCAPSRAVLLTGLRPDTTGITTLDQPVSKTAPDAVTLPRMFRDAGYTTLSFGKVYHHASDDPRGWSVRADDESPALRAAEKAQRTPNLSNRSLPDRAALPDTMRVDMAVKALPGLATSGKPFMMMVGIHRPHLPFVSPPEDWARYASKTVPGPINAGGQKGAPPWAIVSWELWAYEDMTRLRPTVPPDRTVELRRAYLAAVSYADSLVGDLMRQLEALKLDRNTIVVLWGDHGFKLGDHGAWAKHSNAEIDIHVPLIVRAPGVTRAGTRSARLVETTDIYPTLAELTAIKPPSNLEGLSMRPLMADPGRPWKQAAFAQYERGGRETGSLGPLVGRTVRTSRYRYTAWIDKGGKLAAQELYDLQTDPTESVNVARDPARSPTLRTVEAIRLGGWRKVRDAVR